MNIHLHITDSNMLRECLDVLHERGISLSSGPPMLATAGPAPSILRGTKHPLEIRYNEITGKQFRLSAAHCQAAGWTGEKRDMPPATRLWCIASDLTQAARLNPNLITEAEVVELLNIPLGGYDSGAGDGEAESEELPPPPAEIDIPSYI